MGLQRIEFGRRDAAPAGACGCGGGGACMCGGHGLAAAQPAPREDAVTGAVTTEIMVDGMTCGHCVRAVTQELSAIPEVTGVDVDLVEGGTSRVRVSSTAALDAEAVDDAVVEAGYRVRSFA